MPQYPMPGGEQLSQAKYLVFDRWVKMNTQAARTGLPDNQLAWAENLQPIAENRWQVVPAAGSAFQSILENMVLAFYATINSQDYAICFTTAGGGWYVNFTTGTVGQFAPDGTFSNAPDATTWQGQLVLINDSKAGYCAWDGTNFYHTGTVGPNFWIQDAGIGYGTPPTVTIEDANSNTKGTTAVATVANGMITGIKVTNPGSGWLATDTAFVVLSGGTGSGATFVPHMTGTGLVGIQINNAGSWPPPSVQPTNPPAGTYNLIFSGGGGSGAAGTATIQYGGAPSFRGSVVAVNLTNPGSGYTSQPTVSWDQTGHPITSASAFPTFGAQMGVISVGSIGVGAAGSGYPASTTLPLVFSSAGTITSAIGTCTTNSSGGVISASVSSGGSYQFGFSPVIAVSSGTGGQVYAHVWPQVPAGTTLAVFQGRVFLGGGNLLQWTGTGANFVPGQTYDDFDPRNASGSLDIVDSDLVHAITALRSLNNYLWIVGDQSVKQIGNLSISNTSPPITLFNILTLSSDQGTIWPKSCISFNRLFMFANPNGIYAVMGSTVQKISDDVDGIFQRLNTSQQPQGAVVDLNSKHLACFLVSYNDPAAGTRSLLLMFDGQKWWLANQGSSIVTIVTFPNPTSDLNTLYGSLNQKDLTQLFAQPNVAVPFVLKTALSHGQNPVQGKRIIRGGFTADAAGAGFINANMDYDSGTVGKVFGVTASSLLVGGANDANNAPVAGSGVYLGATITGTMANFFMQNVILEYQPTQLWKGGSPLPAGSLYTTEDQTSTYTTEDASSNYRTES